MVRVTILKMCSLRSRDWMVPPLFGSDTPPRGVSDEGRAWVVLAKRCALRAHWMGRVRLLLRAEYGGAIEKTWRLLIKQDVQKRKSRAR